MVLPAWRGTITDDKGNVQPGKRVRVRHETPGAPLAKLYEDRNGNTPLGNPITSDAVTARVDFHIPSGVYRFEFPDSSTPDWRYVAIGLAAEFASPAAGVSWLFDDGTADADPGNGNLRFNNATPESATEIYISATDADGLSQDISLESLDDGGDASDRGLIVIRQADGGGVVVATVTGSVTGDGSPASYYTVPVSILAASGAIGFAAGSRTGVLFAGRGVDGEDGTDGEVATAGTPAAGEYARFTAADTVEGVGKAATFNDTKQPATEAATGVTEFSTTAEVRAAGASDDTVIRARKLREAAALVALSESGGAVAVDWTAGINFSLTLDGDHEISNPSNGIPGTWRTIMVVGNDGTDRSPSFGSNFEVSPELTDVSSTNAYLVSIYCITATRFRAYADEGGDPT